MTTTAAAAAVPLAALGLVYDNAAAAAVPLAELWVVDDGTLVAAVPLAALALVNNAYLTLQSIKYCNPSCLMIILYFDVRQEIDSLHMYTCSFVPLNLALLFR